MCEYCDKLNEFGEGPDITMKEKLKVLHENCLYRMNALLGMKDKEEAHIRADNILCEVLEKIGFHDVVNVFHEIDKWYA